MSTYVVTVAVTSDEDTLALALATSVADFAETIADAGDGPAHTFIGDPVRVTP